MPAKVEDLNRYFKKYLTIRTGEGEVTGKVMSVSGDGIAIRSHGSTQVYDLTKISGFEEVVRIRRKRIIRRWVRTIPPDASVKQHLADRHGILVSVLNAVGEEVARAMHDKIRHDDLGHRHRDPEDRLHDLEDLRGEIVSDDDEDDEDDDE